MLNNSIVDLHFGYIRNPIISYPSAITMFFGLVLLTSQFKSNYLGWLGKNTLVFMGLQIGTGYVAIFGNKIEYAFGLNIDSNLLAVMCLLVFMVVATLCTYFINQHMSNLISLKREKE